MGVTNKFYAALTRRRERTTAYWRQADKLARMIASAFDPLADIASRQPGLEAADKWCEVASGQHAFAK